MLTVACGVLVVAAVVASASLLRADADFLASRLAYNGYTSGDAVSLAQDALARDPLSIKYARGIAQARAAVVFREIADPTASKDSVRALYGDAKAAAELEDRFSEPLAFGTGGLRGFMAAGLRRMNRPNVRRATLGLAAGRGAPASPTRPCTPTWRSSSRPTGSLRYTTSAKEEAPKLTRIGPQSGHL